MIIAVEEKGRVKAMADKEYIERGALKDSFCEACSTKKRYQRTNDECRNHIDSYGNGCFKMRYIDEAPAADVVEVVRCKDCKHFVSEVCRHDFAMNLCRGDDFCSYGERKEQT